jgi:hypothetical protein
VTHLLLQSARRNLARYDETNGTIVGSEPRGSGAERLTGRCFRLADALVALYVDGGRVWLQIGPLRFALDDPKVRVDYAHDRAAGRTRFEVRGPSGTWSHTYPAWWAEQGLAVDEVRFQPERDEDEDRLGFVHAVFRDPEAQRRLVGQWTRGAGAAPPP